MPLAPIFDTVFGPLFGRPCWNVRPGYGTFLTFEFGLPHLEIQEPRKPSEQVQSARVRRLIASRRVWVRGEWHLWIYCYDWRVWQGKKFIGDWTSDRGIRRAAEVLDGQQLTSATIRLRGCRTVFEFDLGGKLETRPYDRTSEQWLLFEPGRHVLTLRADSKYSYCTSDTRKGQGKWEPIGLPPKV